MIPRSLRWRLTLSYAAIALLTTLALGAVLLGSLRRFYRQQELDYLTGNAQAISQALTPLLDPILSPAALESQLSSFAFLSQTRVRLLDQEQVILADSGPPEALHDVLALSLEVNVEIEANAARQTITRTIGAAGGQQGYAPFIVVNKASVDEDVWTGSQIEVDVTRRLGEDAEGGEVLLKKTVTVSGSDPLQIDEVARQELGLADLHGLITVIPAVGTPYGFGFNPAQLSSNRRSSERVDQPLHGLDGRPIGTVELSEGPAYGDQVLASVAWGWGLASGVAVLIAGLVGWVFSRRISTPLLTLTEVTGRMAGGDLSRRATITGRDEVGSLAISFNEMADQVEATVTALRRFVADAAHELHTPLTALRTNLELAAPAADHVERTTFLASAQAQAERLQHLTNSLLDLSRLEVGPGQSNFSPVDLTDLVAAVHEPTASQAEQAGLIFNCELPCEPLIVHGNSGQLRQVLDNLLDNAIKFTPAGGAVTLGLHRTEAGAALWVEDTGIGIPTADVPHLFSRFHRGRNATGYPGSGLGLAIVKAIIERHAGQIEGQPLGQGTRFLLRLNLDENASTAYGSKVNAST